jgi:hypothetical protein
LFRHTADATTNALLSTIRPIPLDQRIKKTLEKKSENGSKEKTERTSETKTKLEATEEVGPGSSDQALLLFTPCFAQRLAYDATFLPSIVQALFKDRVYADLLSGSPINITTAVAVVDRLPAPSKPWVRDSTLTSATLRSQHPPISDDGCEGMAFVVGHASDIHLASTEETHPQPKAITFQLRMAQTKKGKLLRTVQIPLASTIFHSGQENTLLVSDWEVGDNWEGLRPVHRPPVSHVTLDLPLVSDQSLLPRLALSAPIMPLTPIRKIAVAMGNVVRRISTFPNDAPESPASGELESAVDLYFKTRGIPPSSVAVWAVIMTRQMYKGLKFKGEKSTPPPSSGWSADPPVWGSQIPLYQLLLRGARFHRVVSGGGGWGNKAGLISLDPLSDFGKSSIASDDEWREADLDLSGLPIGMLGNIASPGKYIQFFIARTDHDDKSISEPDPGAWTLDFGTIPSTIDAMPDSESFFHLSENSKAVERFTNHFGVLSEKGVAFGFAASNKDGSELQNWHSTKVDIPYSRFSFRHGLDEQNDKATQKVKPVSIAPSSVNFKGEGKSKVQITSSKSKAQADSIVAKAQGQKKFQDTSVNSKVQSTEAATSVSPNSLISYDNRIASEQILPRYYASLKGPVVERIRVNMGLTLPQALEIFPDQIKPALDLTMKDIGIATYEDDILLKYHADGSFMQLLMKEETLDHIAGRFFLPYKMRRVKKLAAKEQRLTNDAVIQSLPTDRQQNQVRTKELAHDQKDIHKPPTRNFAEPSVRVYYSTPSQPNRTKGIVDELHKIKDLEKSNGNGRLGYGQEEYRGFAKEFARKHVVNLNDFADEFALQPYEDSTHGVPQDPHLLAKYIEFAQNWAKEEGIPGLEEEDFHSLSFRNKLAIREYANFHTKWQRRKQSILDNARRRERRRMAARELASKVGLDSGNEQLHLGTVPKAEVEPSSERYPQKKTWLSEEQKQQAAASMKEARKARRLAENFINRAMYTSWDDFAKATKKGGMKPVEKFKSLREEALEHHTAKERHLFWLRNGFPRVLRRKLFKEAESQLRSKLDDAKDDADKGMALLSSQEKKKIQLKREEIGLNSELIASHGPSKINPHDTLHPLRSTSSERTVSSGGRTRKRMDGTTELRNGSSRRFVVATAQGGLIKKYAYEPSDEGKLKIIHVASLAPLINSVPTTQSVVAEKAVRGTQRYPTQKVETLDPRSGEKLEKNGAPIIPRSVRLALNAAARMGARGRMPPIRKHGIRSSPRMHIISTIEPIEKRIRKVPGRLVDPNIESTVKERNALMLEIRRDLLANIPKQKRAQEVRALRNLTPAALERHRARICALKERYVGNERALLEVLDHRLEHKIKRRLEISRAKGTAARRMRKSGLLGPTKSLPRIRKMSSGVRIIRQPSRRITKTPNSSDIIRAVLSEPQHDSDEAKESRAKFALPPAIDQMNRTRAIVPVSPSSWYENPAAYAWELMERRRIREEKRRLSKLGLMRTEKAVQLLEGERAAHLNLRKERRMLMYEAHRAERALARQKLRRLKDEAFGEGVEWIDAPARLVPQPRSLVQPLQIPMISNPTSSTSSGGPFNKVFGEAAKFLDVATAEKRAWEEDDKYWAEVEKSAGMEDRQNHSRVTSPSPTSQPPFPQRASGEDAFTQMEEKLASQSHLATHKGHENSGTKLGTSEWIVPEQPSMSTSTSYPLSTPQQYPGEEDALAQMERRLAEEGQPASKQRTGRKKRSMKPVWPSAKDDPLTSSLPSSVQNTSLGPLHIPSKSITHSEFEKARMQIRAAKNKVKFARAGRMSGNVDGYGARAGAARKGGDKAAVRLAEEVRDLLKDL